MTFRVHRTNSALAVFEGVRNVTAILADCSQIRKD